MNLFFLKDKSIKISQAFSSSSLMSKNMNYVKGESKQFIYSKSQWSVTPNNAINDMFLKLLRKVDVFKSVHTSKSRIRSDYMLEINVEDFMQYFSEDGNKSYANVVITLSLLQSGTNSVIASKTFNSKVDVETLNAEGGVDSLNIGLSNIMSISSQWLGEVCK